MKTSEDKFSAPFLYFLKPSDQNNLDERKEAQKGQNRSLPDSSNDDLVTGLEFTEVLSGLSKETAPGSGRSSTQTSRTCQ